MPPKSQPKPGEETMKRPRASSITEEHTDFPDEAPSKRVKIAPEVPKDVTNAEQNPSPLTEDPKVELHGTFQGSIKQVEDTPTPKDETPQQTLERLVGLKVGSECAIPPWVDKLMETVKDKKKLVAKNEVFTEEEKNTIVEIIDFIQDYVKITSRMKVLALSPGQYAEAWNTVKRGNGDTSTESLILLFLEGILLLPDGVVVPINNALITCGALLLGLSCVIHDFGEYVRDTYHKEIFGCCVITNATDQLGTLSGKFIENAGDEMHAISEWVNPEKSKVTRVEHTLSIGGESGSGKTRAALQCAKLIEGRGEGDEADKDYLTVYIKLSDKDDETLGEKDIHSYFTKEEDKTAAKNYVTINGIKGAEALDHHMRRDDITKEDRNRLRVIRAHLCADFVKKKYLKSLNIQSLMQKRSSNKCFLFLTKRRSARGYTVRQIKCLAMVLLYQSYLVNRIHLLKKSGWCAAVPPTRRCSGMH
ncbi:hypothetical protein AGDE_15089 [Angomonas deanei]|uniref:Uncharacterized protein n=1 Tax=Angomonas deanei TaxID=59799 RepID=A0A7G2CPU7_9TRYP|nr:hypothetical protein AGDE_15089 [Angomonas deanei]CAD2221127.1 hypothetical protein, conserved [Angomonas deanei]|eukprot:EPY19738.1 hypothetical protein AGDE_15089 [Angomonas deanei]